MESTLSIRLKTLRKSLSMTTAQVIKLLKKSNITYSEQSIYKWEQGSVVPSLETLKELSKIYNCNISYLVEGKKYKYLRITPSENLLLNIYRTDFLFRSIITQVIKKLDRSH